MTQHLVPVRLRQAVAGLGQAGDVKLVKFGYARNFLVARGLGVLVSDGVASTALEQQAKRTKPSSERHEIVSVASALTGRTATIIAPANADGTLFASVQADDVAAALETDPLFRMEPLKHTGEHVVILDFGHDITASITVTIRPQANQSRRRA